MEGHVRKIIGLTVIFDVQAAKMAIPLHERVEDYIKKLQQMLAESESRRADAEVCCSSCLLFDVQDFSPCVIFRCVLCVSAGILLMYCTCFLHVLCSCACSLCFSVFLRPCFLKASMHVRIHTHMCTYAYTYTYVHMCVHAGERVWECPCVSTAQKIYSEQRRLENEILCTVGHSVVWLTCGDKGWRCIERQTWQRMADIAEKILHAGRIRR